MPPPITTDHLLDLVRKSELIAPPRLEAFVHQVSAAADNTTAREMADLLVAAGLLTQFQAEQFLQGKWRGFTIGKYRVLERIGAGGMGTVYLCEHLMVGRRVAIKVLPTSQADNPSALGRFYREGRAAGVLDHPNLVKAHDIDQDGGLHFLVMDYVEGSNLQDIIARFGPLPVERACHYIKQAAQGLQHAHQCGLVHRDVKPANLLLERNGTVRVLDLGLARFFHDNSDQLTLKYDDRNVLGTADYVSPEQALNSHEVDIRADIYSLGATFYFCLTGQPPFPGGKVAQKLIWHQVRQPAPIRQLRAEVPESLAAIVSRMMAKNPAQRYQTPAEVVAVLTRWTTTPIPPPPEAEMPRLSPAVSPTTPPAERHSRSAVPVVAKTRSRGASTAAMPHPRTMHDAGERLLGIDLPRPSAAEQATPRALHTTTPTETDRLRDAAPVRPSDRLPFANPRAEAARAAEQSRRRQALRLAVLLLIGVGLGLGLRWIVGLF